MKKKNETINKDYWEKNIEGFSGFYDTQSEEKINNTGLYGYLYKKLIFPIEQNYMYQRHKYVSDFISMHVKPEMKTADVGCGSGIYSRQMEKNGAFVYAYDYAESAVNLTVKNLSQANASNYYVGLLDITKNKIQKVDIAISIGVLTYIDDFPAYFNNILPYTDFLLFNYLDRKNWINMIRRSIRLLDVRDYSYHGFEEISRELNKNNFEIVSKTKLATGFILGARKI